MPKNIELRNKEKEINMKKITRKIAERSQQIGDDMFSAKAVNCFKRETFYSRQITRK